jgi:hypothetical protein
MNYSRQSIFRVKSSGAIVIFVESYGDTIKACNLNGTEGFNKQSLEYLGEELDIELAGRDQLDNNYYAFGDYKFNNDDLYRLGVYDGNDCSLPYKMTNSDTTEWANVISCIPFSTIEYIWKDKQPKQDVSSINSIVPNIDLSSEDIDSTIPLPQMQRAII